MPTVAPDAGNTAGTAEAPLSATASGALLARGRAARAEGDLTAAAVAIERALRIEPNDAEIWLEYGYIEFAGGDFEQALTLGRKAASLAGSRRELRDAASKLIADANREGSRAVQATERESERH